MFDQALAARGVFRCNRCGVWLVCRVDGGDVFSIGDCTLWFDVCSVVATLVVCCNCGAFGCRHMNGGVEHGGTVICRFAGLFRGPLGLVNVCCYHGIRRCAAVIWGLKVNDV